VPPERPGERHSLRRHRPALLSDGARRLHRPHLLPGVCRRSDLPHGGLRAASAPALQRSVLDHRAGGHLLHGLQGAQLQDGSVMALFCSCFFTEVDGGAVSKYGQIWDP